MDDKGALFCPNFDTLSNSLTKYPWLFLASGACAHRRKQQNARREADGQLILVMDDRRV
jgi:hypothetical protein